MCSVVFVYLFVFVNTDIAKKIVNLFKNIINAFPRTVMRSSSVKWTAVWCLNCCTSFWQMKCVHRQLSEKSVKYLEGVSRGEQSCPFFFCFSKQILFCFLLLCFMILLSKLTDCTWQMLKNWSLPFHDISVDKRYISCLSVRLPAPCERLGYGTANSWTIFLKKLLTNS